MGCKGIGGATRGCVRHPLWWSRQRPQQQAQGVGHRPVFLRAQLVLEAEVQLPRRGGRQRLCINNNNRFDRMLETSDYCVVNPLTRTCIVLPKPPFLPWHWLFPSTTSSTTLTICGGNLWADHNWNWATYDLATGGAGRWHSAVYRIEDLFAMNISCWVRPVMCANEIYFYNSGTLQVAPCPGPDRPLVEVTASVSIPSVTLLGLNPATHHLDPNEVLLVAHGDTLYLIAVVRHDIVPHFDCDGGCGVWRLARDRMEWEAVARLDVSEVERLTGWNCREYELLGFNCNSCDRIDCRRKSGVFGACWVQDLLCCNYVLPVSRPQGFAYCLLGFNLNTGEWVLVNDEKAMAVPHNRVFHCLPRAVDAFELRLDLFLPETVSGDDCKLA